MQKKSSGIENSLIIKTQNFEENPFTNYDTQNKIKNGSNHHSLQVEDKHQDSFSSEKIPFENDESVEYNKNNYMEKIKTITHFKEYKKTFTKDTEVIGLENEEDYNYLKYQMSNQTHSVSMINTLDRDNIFYNNPSWLLSNRLINDEKNYLNRQITINKPDYKFLEKVREDSQKAIVMKTKFFLELNEDAFYNLLSFIYDQYKILIQINKLIQRKVCLTLNCKFERVVREFRENYGDVLELQEFYFKPIEIKKSNGYVNGVHMGNTESNISLIKKN